MHTQPAAPLIKRYPLWVIGLVAVLVQLLLSLVSLYHLRSAQPRHGCPSMDELHYGLPNRMLVYDFAPCGQPALRLSVGDALVDLAALVFGTGMVVLLVDAVRRDANDYPWQIWLGLLSLGGLLAVVSGIVATAQCHSYEGDCWLGIGVFSLPGAAAIVLSFMLLGSMRRKPPLLLTGMVVLPLLIVLGISVYIALGIYQATH